MKKALSLVLAAAMALGLLALAPLTASAAGVPSVGDKVYFGQYPQSAYTPSSPPSAPAVGTIYTEASTRYVYQDGSYFKFEPIEWRVLSNSGGELFLLAEKNLDSQKAYNATNTAITWENCALRKFLNGTPGHVYSYNFIGWAFTAAEQAAIKTTSVSNPLNPDFLTIPSGNTTNDKIFLLSIGEAQDAALGFVDNTSRVAVNTAYTAKFPYTTGAGVGNSWRLRSPGSYTHAAAIVYHDGTVYSAGDFVTGGGYGVRPALKLDLSSVSFTTDAGGKTLVTLAPGITGPTTMSLTAGYAATSTGAYTITGIAPVTVTKQSGNAKITWNNTTKKLDIAAGLAAGTYPVVLKAANGTTPDATLTFTLTVNPAGATTYTLTLNANGGSVTPATVTQAAGSTYALPTPTRSGYTFTSWTLSGGGTLNGSTYTFGTSNGTVTAQWTAIVTTYTLTLNANGGSVTPTSVTQAAGTTYALPTPTRSGYTFTSWALSGGGTLSGSTYTFGTSNGAVTAQWTAIVTTYPVTVNNGTGSGNYAAGATVNITADAAPSGKVFDRWTATGVTLSNPTSASASFTMPANAVTLTATYKDAEKAWTIWDWIIYIFFFGWLWM
ncbi:MAG: DUF6273 domain-containing protein [Oscillospiraceae bacterium]|jgi:uncharacterized repeat protein (TIGR02543 family)|nr:DUF6273 domain-containing protein [Oscillospiraceae bacterium]